MILSLLLGLAVGYAVRSLREREEGTPSSAPGLDAETRPQAQLWTCSMHPQIQLPKPGQCPICSMDLIPLKKGVGAEEERVLTMSEAAKSLAEIDTTEARRELATAKIRFVGKVAYDETRLGHITAWVPGRIDRLFVDYTGIPVREGDHMAYLYSPELYTAQEELIQSIKTFGKTKESDIALIRNTAAATVEAAREKLRLLGVTQEQIRRVENSGKASPHMTVYSPVGGIVVQKNAFEGMYVDTGTRIYTVADLSRVWVKLDAYEMDLSWVRYGQAVTVETEAYPGRAFTGRVAFIDPVLDSETRTAKVRLNVDNAEGLLKPGMFVRALLETQLTEDGKAVEPELAGKWMCPMHPEILKEEPGVCDICEMPLVKTETLGFAAREEPLRAPLLVPATAPLVTGARAVVYVERPDRKRPTYEGREVVLGPRAGDDYIVREGLRDGERVVTRGNFKIDSALQIQAKPSMMSAKGEEEGTQSVRHEAHSQTTSRAFRERLSGILEGYYAVWRALASDDASSAKSAAERLSQSLEDVDMNLLEGRDRRTWMKNADELRRLVSNVAKAEGITQQREAFALLSEALYAVVERFGSGMDAPVRRAYCPMAFDNRGARWLQDSDEILNPYFGDTMLRCGEIERRMD